MLGGNMEENSSSKRHDTDFSAEDFLRMARRAVEQAQPELAVHLYIAAYEQDLRQTKAGSATGLAALRKAWSLACSLKDHALAEHIFEKLEPSSSPEANAEYAHTLQNMALSRLEEFGLSEHDAAEITTVVADENSIVDFFKQLKASLAKDSNEAKGKTSSTSSSHEGGLLIPPSPFRVAGQRATKEKSEKLASSGNAAQEQNKKGHVLPTNDANEIHPISFKDLIGYDVAKEQMKSFGIGVAHDERFKSFLDMLARRHGISSLPVSEAMLFRASSREDATYFMHATVGELGLPAVRMYVDDSMQGAAMLCVMATEDFQSRSNIMRSGFDEPALLLLENIDLWADAFAIGQEDNAANVLNQLAHGAREALVFIHMAVESPNITVLASCSQDGYPDAFIDDCLGSVTCINIDNPNREERAAVWKHTGVIYPSLRYLDVEDLVRVSEGMSRYDIYSAAREAVEQAYSESIAKRAYVPVTKSNIYDKIAAYQPLDSEPYAELESSVIEDFRKELEHIDDLLNDE